MNYEGFYCPECGAQIRPNGKFCEYCGTKLNIIPEQKQKINMRCSDCGAIMEYIKKDRILFCPYCGSKNILPEGDTIAKQAGRVYKDIKIHGQQMKRDVELERIALEKERIKAEQSEERQRIKSQELEIERLQREERKNARQHELEMEKLRQQQRRWEEEQEEKRKYRESGGCIGGFFRFIFVDIIGGILGAILRIITFGWLSDIFEDLFDDGDGCLGCIPRWIKIITIIFILLALASRAATA